MVDPRDIPFDESEFDIVETEAGLETELSAFEIAGLAIGGVTAINGAAVMASLAPVYTGVMAAAAGGLGWTGYRRRHELPLNPFSQEKAAKVEAAAKSVVKSDVAPEDQVPVTDFSGKPVDIEGL